MEARPVKIFTTSIVPRLQYAVDLIFNDILGLSWELVTDKRKLGKNPVINYSDRDIPDSLKIIPDNLLFETGVKSREINVTYWKNLPVFFQTPGNPEMPFDIFAATFYMVSRYEEYLDFKPDEFGRFNAADSLSYKNGFLRTAVVDLWAKEFARILVRKFETLAFKRNEFRAMVTVDVDEPFAYLGKSLITSINGLIHDLVKSPDNAGKRLRCLNKDEKDPYAVFDYISETIELNDSDAKFFFPVGDGSEFDKNPSWKNKEYRNLINMIASRFDAGLLTSFFASDKTSLIARETGRLNEVISKDIIHNRFHFLKFRLPDSYRKLISYGIREDFSMGYADEPGFRAGISRPFWFYDVIEDATTKLKIFPFQIMDVSLSEHKRLTPEQAKEVIVNIINETVKTGGLFVSIWHNTSLLDNPGQKKWRELFEFTLRYQKA